MTGLGEFGALNDIAAIRDAINKIKTWSKTQNAGAIAFRESAALPFKNVQDAIDGISLATLGVSMFARTLLDDADASAVLSTLGISTFIKTLLDDADAATARATLEISSGSYTPTGAGIANVDSVTPGESNYIRVGPAAFVSFYAAVDPTAAGSTSTTIELSLPIASAFTSARQLAGVGSTAGIWTSVDVEAGAANDRASIRFPSPTTSAIAVYGVYGYRII